MENHFLIVGAPFTGKADVVKFLFGQDLPSGSQSGVVLNDLVLTNKYFTARLGVWVDEICEEMRQGQMDSQQICSQLSAWCQEFSSAELLPVRQKLSGIVFTFSPDDDMKYVSTVCAEMTEMKNSLQKASQQEDWSGFMLAYSRNPVSELVEDVFDEAIIELTTDKSRVREVVETQEWHYEDESLPEEFQISNDQDIAQIVNQLKSAKETISQMHSKQERQRYAAHVIRNLR